jgi:hypothetical protein
LAADELVFLRSGSTTTLPPHETAVHAAPAASNATRTSEQAITVERSRGAVGASSGWLVAVAPGSSASTAGSARWVALCPRGVASAHDERTLARGTRGDFFDHGHLDRDRGDASVGQRLAEPLSHAGVI